jgi:programmed cell death protein 5
MDPSQIPSQQEVQQQQQQQAAQEENRLSILDQILEPAAKTRLSRLSLVKKEFARSVEDSVINAAKSGQLKARVTEEHLIAMLEQLSGSKEGDGGGVGGGKGGITIQRRKTGFEDDDDDSDSDLA